VERAAEVDRQFGDVRRVGRFGAALHASRAEKGRSDPARRSEAVVSTTDTTPRVRTTTAFDQEPIPRYSMVERINHWFGAITYTYCLMTGLAFWTPYLYWMAAIVGGGATARFWHPWFGIFFTVSQFLMFLHWSGDMEVDNDDRVWADNIQAYIENEDDKLPPVGRFNWGQKLYFWGMVGSTILLLLSGFVLWYVEAVAWNIHILRYVAILVHASVALITIGLFLIHVYMSTVLEEGSFGSMIHGTVTRAWAWTFHRKWYYKVTGRARPAE
jgi:formate dehydrogenase subunit gamma